MGVELAARLEWWANASTLLESADIELVIENRTGTLRGFARLVDRSTEAAEGIAFFRELDSLFTLRFADNSVVEVTVEPTDDPHGFVLTEFVERRSDQASG